MKIKGFITHKAAELYSDCADFFRICPHSKRVAVSDGVSQSIMPAEWAQILVNAFVNEEWLPGESTRSLKDKWLSLAWDYVARQKDQGINPWMLENCLLNNEGAAATFCGVTFQNANEWKASVLGDSALVVLDENNRIIHINSSKEGTFDNRPDYFDSVEDDRGSIREFSGLLQKDEKILLVSDPFSELFQKIQGKDEEICIVSKLLNLSDIDEFCSVVGEFRDKYHMHNDDSTLVIIEHDGSGDFNVVYEKPLCESIEEEKIRLEKERQEFEQKKKTDENLWEKAIEENSDSSYREYLESSPLCNHRREAEKRIQQIENEKADSQMWEDACSINTIQGYQQYLDNFPSGRYFEEAKVCLERLGIVSTHNKTPESSKDTSEDQSAEDPFCQRKEQREEEQQVTESDGLDHKGTTTETDIQTESSTQSSVGEEPSERKEDGRPDETREEVTGGISSGEETGIEQPDRKTGINQKEMEVEEDIETTELSLPMDVDPSDGIDLFEFRKLQETALLVFKRYRNRFETALGQHKWKDDIDQCFMDYWHELERIIYQEKNNG